MRVHAQHETHPLSQHLPCPCSCPAPYLSALRPFSVPSSFVCSPMMIEMHTARFACACSHRRSVTVPHGPLSADMVRAVGTVLSGLVLACALGPAPCKFEPRSCLVEHAFSRLANHAMTNDVCSSPSLRRSASWTSFCALAALIS